MIRVLAKGYIRTLLKKDELNFDLQQTTVNNLLRTISSMIAQNQPPFSTDSILVTVNGVEISALAEDNTVIKSNDEVMLIPVTHGG
jgi:molybdopterin converting factor small subunit